MTTASLRRAVAGTRAQRGFTLVEIVVALAITAVIVGTVAMLMTTPMNAYLNQTNEAVLVDASEGVARRLADDLRHALPNSVSIRNAGTRSIIEMLRVESVGFYQGSGALSDAVRELDFTAADARFSLFGRIDPAASGPYTLNAAHLVAGNRGRGVVGFDAYRLGVSPGVITPNGTTIDVTPDVASHEEALTITPPYRFRDPGPGPLGQRLFLVSGPVSYVCNSAVNARALRRYSGYPISPNIPASEAAPQLGTATVEVLASDVAACRVRCQGGAANVNVCAGTLVVQLDLSRPNSTGGSSIVRLHQQYPIDNAP